MEGVSDAGEQILLPAVLSIIALWAAKSLGFFSFPESTGPSPRIFFWQVISVFAIYLGCALFVPFIAQNLLTHLGRPELAYVSTESSQLAYSQLVTLLSSAFFLFIFCIAQKDKASMRLIWKRPLVHPTTIRWDFGIGMLAWIVSFPIVSAIGSIADLTIDAIFGKQEYEQVAVRYLKTSLESEILATLALITIVLSAPIIEEFLFRGFLQNFIKRHLGRNAAILITSLIFSLFHFSLSQDLGNIPLVTSLFVLALFLGFIYERQQSLFASIGLHMTFNTISVLRILLF